jgi:predicted lipid-binding transport protein (Tim44 family)
MAATETTAPTVQPREIGDWQGGVVGGLAGGLVFGAMLSLLMPAVVESAIPALWGLEGGLAGWFIHMANAAILGVAFAALVPYALDRTPTAREVVGLGIIYGAVLWVLLAVLLMPVWLSAVGFANAPPLPNVNWMSFLGHLAYGAVLGGVYAALNTE